MRQRSFGADVSLPAEHLVAVERELVEQIFLLRPGLLQKFRERRFDLLEFPRMRFEVRMNADKVRQRAHAGNRSARLFSTPRLS
jgi:hypothetical protein